MELAADIIAIAIQLAIPAIFGIGALWLVIYMPCYAAVAIGAYLYRGFRFNDWRFP